MMNSSVFVVALSCLLGVFACDLDTKQYCQDLWSPWKSLYGKSYKTIEEDTFRLQVFCSSLETIRNHNANSYHGWSMSLNHFADLTPQEWKSHYANSFRVYGQPLLYGVNTFDFDNQDVDADADGTLPASVNWVDRGKISPVKNQGQCGSCWSFSTTGAIEGRVAIANDAPPVSLSEQELVDCSVSYGNHGCNGGMMDFGFEYALRNNGLCTEAAYPYEAKDDTCRSSACKHVSPIRGYSNVNPGDETALMAAVAKGPVSIAIEADQSSFQFYSKGVMDGSCGRSLDHGVLVVGYGYDDNQDLNYWIVKNSWGTTWGERGYIRLVRNATMNDGYGQCGILSSPSFPLI